jgi:hypothetical protein
MPEFKHVHAGQAEPRAHGEIYHENRNVDLNSAAGRGFRIYHPQPFRRGAALTELGLSHG